MLLVQLFMWILILTKSNFNVSLEGFSKGVYFVRIQGKNQQQTIKWIKQ